jgi:hypothetical protein
MDPKMFDGAWMFLDNVPELLRPAYHERDGRIVLRPESELQTEAELAALAEVRRLVEARSARRRPPNLARRGRR